MGPIREGRGGGVLQGGSEFFWGVSKIFLAHFTKF